ncbi:energy-coupling factor transporter transmembrane protein EcfT [Desulfovibrio mangrovi]|uniref:energy-coupling factor transporter transmembrane component T family protein n=1 Tax=Desulfovibrio mangrovi TaxID=2976983 RepID=UPI002245BA76|nr:energy-coupling factor transporter transmembrane component T [Desulfovibrio mangrovi]UZP68534.1 energy-coupling factor transporter transmembrane protein EcfT [Desulfovibrio mangrovi]
MQPARLTLYVEGTSWLHSRHPFSKLAYILLTGVVVYCAPGGWIPDAAILTLNIILAAHCRVLLPLWKLSWRTLLPLSIFMLPIHGLLFPHNHTPVCTVFTVTLYAEGLHFAATILLQLAAILTASLLFVYTTHPAGYITALTQAGWPPFVSYLLGSPLLMLPAMRARTATIQAAQRARGLDSEAGITSRIRALAPLVTPLVLGAFAEVEQRAIALELRGFSSTTLRTSLREVQDSSQERLARRLMLVTSTGLILYALTKHYLEDFI